MSESKPLVIGTAGFEVVGTQYGGWVVMRPRGAGSGNYCFDPFMAAFTTFDEMLKWLGEQARYEPRQSGEVEI